MAGHPVMPWCSSVLSGGAGGRVLCSPAVKPGHGWGCVKKTSRMKNMFSDLVPALKTGGVFRGFSGKNFTKDFPDDDRMFPGAFPRIGLFR
ncbi:hypothetical protein [Novacetimonas sp. GS1]